MADIRDFKLPDLGEGLEEGDIVEWHVEVGDLVELNQAVADIETAKAIVAVPSPFAGRVVERIGDVGETLQVGTVFLRIDIEGGSGTAGSDRDDGTAERFHQDAQAAARSVEQTSGIFGEVKFVDSDEDDEPQPLVGYGQGKVGTRRRRRTRRGRASAGERRSVGGSARPLAKPPVRKLAKDLGVDLAAVAPGSGPDGVITREDVHAAASGTQPVPTASATAVPVGSPGSAPTSQQVVGARAGGQPVPGFRGRTPGSVEPIRGIRKRIVEKMELSRSEIPEATCSRTTDVTALWELRKALTDQAKADGLEIKITPFALIMRATVLALRRFPTLNARIDRDAGEIHLLEHINLGLAADTERGLVVPNIKDAHAKSTLQLATEVSELAGRARDGSIGPGDLTGGTFTVNNYGAFGNDDGNPIINHPEGAILGIGAIRERPWVAHGELTVRRVATFTLAFDHRICDGGEAGRFVAYVAHLCERPALMLLYS